MSINNTKNAQKEDEYAILDALADSVIILGKDKNIKFINNEAAHLFAVYPSRAKGKKIEKLFLTAGNYGEKFEPVNLDTITSERRTSLFKIINKEKNIYRLSFSVSKTSEGGHIIFFYNNAEINRAALFFNELILNKSMQNDFINRFSDALRNPLINIITELSNLEQTKKKPNHTEKCEKHLQMLNKESLKLQKGIDGFLQLFIMNFELFEVNMQQNIDIVALIKGICTSTQNHLIKTNFGVKNLSKVKLVFKSNIAEANITCDPGKITSIMLNLLYVALKFIDIADAATGKIEINLSVYEHLFEVSIKQFGKEILGSIKRIFAQQLNPIRTNRQEDSKVSELYGVRELVEKMGGYVNHKPSGSGTEVTVIVPVIKKKENIVKQPSKGIENDLAKKVAIEFSDIDE